MSKGGISMKQGIVPVWRWLSGLLLSVIGLSALLLPTAMALGLSPYPITSDAMAPTYPEGSLLFVRSTDPATILPGQVITYLESPSQVSTSRVVQKFPDPKDPTVFRFRVQGDNAAAAEPVLVHSRNILGTPVCSLPGLGRAVSQISSPHGYLAGAVGCMILAVLVFLPELLTSGKPSLSDLSP